MTVRNTACAALVAVGAALSADALAQPNFAPQPLELVQVQDDLYMIRNNQSGNVTMLVSDEGVLLIDDKFEFDYENIVEQVRTVTDAPIKYVINTHYHQDHSGGNSQMQAANAVVFASENARREMVEVDQAGLPNVTLDDYLRIYLGGLPIDIHYFGRGHTDGDVVIHLPEHDVVVMGDLFAAYDPYFQFVHYAAGGSARDWTRTLERALQLDFDTVIPGHAAVTDRGQLRAFADETLRLQNMVREMNRQDRSRDDIEAMLRSEFGWSDFVIPLSLDGIIVEMQ